MWLFEAYMRTWASLVAQWWRIRLPGQETCSFPGLGRSPREGNGYPPKNSCLENPMDRGTWWASVHAVAKSRTQLSDLAHLHTRTGLTCFTSFKSKVPRLHCGIYCRSWLTTCWLNECMSDGWKELFLPAHFHMWYTYRISVIQPSEHHTFTGLEHLWSLWLAWLHAGHMGQMTSQPLITDIRF